MYIAARMVLAVLFAYLALSLVARVRADEDPLAIGQQRLAVLKAIHQQQQVLIQRRERLSV